MPVKSKRYFSYTDQKARRRNGLRIVVSALVVFLAYEALSCCFLRPVIVVSASMEPTLQKGDRVFASPVVYGLGLPGSRSRLFSFTRPARGDLVLVDPPFRQHHSAFDSLRSEMTRLFTFQRFSGRGRESRGFEGPVIKRVIGIPGDTVVIDKYVARVKGTGAPQPLTEFELSRRPYAVREGEHAEGNENGDLLSGDSMGALVLGPNEYFLMNDNRVMSGDSRSWGAVGFSRIRGVVFGRHWPIRAR